MTFSPTTIFDWRDRQFRTHDGYLTFRLYESGWLVRFTPFDAAGAASSIEGVDVSTACWFANTHVL